MRTFADQTGKAITIPDHPERIVSVVPSQTELLFTLGLEAEVAGITKFCIHPKEWHQVKPQVGGTKNLNIERIRALHPDLIIANKEENEQSQVEELAREFPVWVTDVRSYPGAKEMILDIGEITNRNAEAGTLTNMIEQAFDTLLPVVNRTRNRSVAYLIWNKPLMAAGSDTFIDSMLKVCGFTNSLGHLFRYPVISDAEISAARPDYIFLSSEPFPFTEKHQKEFSGRFPGIKAVCVNGEMFSWYGSRLLHSPAYFLKLLEQIESVE